jgi:hypothetical protein
MSLRGKPSNVVNDVVILTPCYTCTLALLLYSDPDETYRVEDLAQSFELSFNTLLLCDELPQRELVLGDAVGVAGGRGARVDRWGVNVVHVESHMVAGNVQ